MVAQSLYIRSSHVGGKISPSLTVKRHTELYKEDILYRAHPSYSNKGSWYDWAYFKWSGYDLPIPGKIMLIIDLSDCDIIYDKDQDPDTLQQDDCNLNVEHLTKEKWIVVSAAESPEICPTMITENNLKSKIVKRIQLHDNNEIYMVPFTSLVGPCFVVNNNIYCDTKDNGTNNIAKQTAYVVEPMTKWGDMFMTN